MTNDVDIVVIPRSSDLGDGFMVKRALPSAQRRMVGPFVFFDQMGPALLEEGEGLDVRPHPHIGLATVTYLFTGELLHRDSLGTVQTIEPGAVNWMTAGRGIVHSERTPAEQRKRRTRLFGIQAWVALPERHEEMTPSFSHHGSSALPVVEGEGKSARIIAGSLYGQQSQVNTLSDMFYADVRLAPDSRLEVPAEHEERAAYVVEGFVTIRGGESYEAGRLLVFKRGVAIEIQSGNAPARLMLLGGEPMESPRFVSWNFVSSSRDRIEQAKEDWRHGRFDKIPGDDGESIPLPERNRPPVNYP